MIKYNCILLDIDGVLNNYTSTKDMPVSHFHERIFSNTPFKKSDFNFDKACINELNYIIESIKHPKIVIVSNWRYYANENNFHEMFDVVGVKHTPIDLISGFEDDNYPDHKRSALIDNYLNACDDINHYCAIDDKPELYSPDFKNLVVTDANYGLTEKDANEVIQRLTSDNYIV